jgi:prevent-host-death family protein
MRHVPIAEFKNRLSELIAAVEAGEEIVITRHGRAAVRVVSMHDQEALRQQREEAVRRLRAHVDQMRAQGRTATAEERKAWINEGRP